MNIYFEDGNVVSDELLEKMTEAARYAIETEGIINLDDDRCEISVTFVGLDEIHKLNREYRGVDRPTDVLSFPQFEDLDEEVPDFGEICLGDVVICRDKAEEQANEFGHSFERELVYLFTHSILHLLGYDHMEADEKKLMRAREEEIMIKIGLPDTEQGAN